MEQFDINQDRIDRYIKKELTGQEALDFISDMDNNIELKKQYENTLMISQVIRENHLLERKEILGNFASGVPKKSSNTKYFPFLLISIGTLGLILLFNFRNSSNSEIRKDENQKQIPPSQQPVVDTLKKLFVEEQPTDKLNQNAEVNVDLGSKKNKTVASVDKKRKFVELAKKLFIVPQNIALITRGGESDEKISKAFDLFKSNKLEECLSFITQEAIDKNASEYLKALVYMKQEKWDKAKTIFKSFSDDDYNEYNQDAKYYLALSYLATFPENEEDLKRLCRECDMSGGSKYEFQFNQIEAFIK